MADQKYTVDEALVEMGFGKFQILVLAYAGMGWISEAMEMMLLSFVGPAVQDEWHLSSNEESLISSVVFAGMFVGAYSWGIVSDNYGRRKGFFITAIVTSVSGFLSALSPNYPTLLIFRCLVGIGLGGGPVLVSWFLEFIPAPKRGTWMVVFSAFWTLGTILEASLAWIVMPSLGWRWLLALSAVPSSLLLLFYGKAPESPRYLCMKGRTSDAVQVLEKIARMNQSKLPSGILASGSQTEKGNRVPLEEAQLLFPGQDDYGIVKEGDPVIQAVPSVITLLSPDLRRSTMLLWVVFIGNAFSYYGLVLLTSELNNGHNKCNRTEVEVGKPEDVNYKDIFITSFAECPGLLLSAAMVDKLGRKFSMSSMLFLCFVFLLPLAVYQPDGWTTLLLFGARICITAAFTVVYIYAPEIYPTSVRTTGVGVASSVGRIGGMMCPLVAVSLVHGCHITAAVVLFEIVIFVSGVCVLMFPHETSGRKLNDNLSDVKGVVELT